MPLPRILAAPLRKRGLAAGQNPNLVGTAMQEAGAFEDTVVELFLTQVHALEVLQGPHELTWGSLRAGEGQS